MDWKEYAVCDCNCGIKDEEFILVQMLLLCAESRWELPASAAAAQVDVTHTESVQKDHMDEPPAAKKKKTAKHTGVSKVVSSCFMNIFKLLYRLPSVLCLQCFDAVGWAAGRASGL